MVAQRTNTTKKPLRITEIHKQTVRYIYKPYLQIHKQQNIKNYKQIDTLNPNCIPHKQQLKYNSNSTQKETLLSSGH